MEVKYTFVHADSPGDNILQDRDMAEYFMKWSLKGNLRMLHYCFNEPFHAYQSQEFAEEFLRSAAALATLPELQGVAVDAVDTRLVPCSALSMSWFDPLLDPSRGVVRGDGRSLVPCMDHQLGPFMVADELRKALLDPDSPNYDVYNEGERDEFLFRLFLHMCLGGQWCQYEDAIEPYLAVTRRLYKALVGVQKDESTQRMHVVSVVLQVKARTADGSVCFPLGVAEDNVQDFAYLVVNPISRHVTLLSHQFGGNFYC